MNTNVCVFVGPTVPVAEAREVLDAVYLPPVAQGDVYRAGLHRPLAIGIIDGYFERVPSVWHKEILWAMAEGIHVLGSASMGALRAAELEAFGMEGVGWIFDAYRSGVLQDDDEVAVAHGPSEYGYSTSSEAMVNIRRTLEEAQNAGIIAATTRGTLERQAKLLYYPERSYATLLARAEDAGVEVSELAALRAWLPHGRVDQKRLDALAMLRQIRERMSTDTGPKRVKYRLENSNAWDYARRHAGHVRIDGTSDSATILTDRLADELRLQPDAYSQLVERTRDKQRVLESNGLDNPGLVEAQVSEAELMAWYFQGCLGREIPGDLATYAVGLGFADRAGLVRAVLREYVYRRAAAKHDPTSV
jgi:hypothetical protein